ncbi:hypothetical protein SCALM49S_08696 [Streptomyces californicus]
MGRAGEDGDHGVALRRPEGRRSAVRSGEHRDLRRGQGAQDLAGRPVAGHGALDGGLHRVGGPGPAERRRGRAVAVVVLPRHDRAGGVRTPPAGDRPVRGCAPSRPRGVGHAEPAVGQLPGRLDHLRGRLGHRPVRCRRAVRGGGRRTGGDDGRCGGRVRRAADGRDRSGRRGPRLRVRYRRAVLGRGEGLGSGSGRCLRAGPVDVLTHRRALQEQKTRAMVANSFSSVDSPAGSSGDSPAGRVAGPGPSATGHGAGERAASGIPVRVGIPVTEEPYPPEAELEEGHLPRPALATARSCPPRRPAVPRRRGHGPPAARGVSSPPGRTRAAPRRIREARGWRPGGRPPPGRGARRRPPPGARTPPVRPGPPAGRSR